MLKIFYKFLKIFYKYMLKIIYKFLGTDVGRVFFSVVCSIIVSVLLSFFLLPKAETPVQSEENSATDRLEISPASAIFEWLQRLPTERSFHIFIGILNGVFVGWRWCLYARLDEDFKEAKKNGYGSRLTPRDWWVVQELRKRVFFLRLGANITLICVIALLFGGIYFLLFLVPQIKITSQFLAQESPLAIFKESFGLHLDHIAQGRYWFKENLSVLKRRYIWTELSEILNGENNSNNDCKTLNENEKVLAKKFHNGGRGVCIGDKGSVLLTLDDGKSWESWLVINLKKDDVIKSATFDEDISAGMITTNMGTVFVTIKKGLMWVSTELDYKKDKLTGKQVDIISDAYLAEDDNSKTHILWNTTVMQNWANWSLGEIGRKINQEPIVRKSQIGEEMIDYLNKTGIPSISRDTTNSTESDGEMNFFDRYVGDFTLERIVIMIVLFYLVQLFVRIYQYNMRLSQFWASRADALLLAQSYSDRNAASFDELVGALAPDTHDFKSMPRPVYETLFDRFRPQRRP